MKKNKDIEYKVIKDCSRLTLDKFFACLFDDDLNTLTISGQPPQEVLIETWQNIYTEYNNLMQGDSYNEVFELTKEVSLLKMKIEVTDSIVKFLQYDYDHQLVSILKSMGLRPNLSPDDSGSILLEKLQSIITRAKSWVTQLDIKTDELLKALGKNANAEKNTGRVYYDDLILSLSRFLQYQISIKEMTVAQFCRGINRMNEFYRQQTIKNTFKK